MNVGVLSKNNEIQNNVSEELDTRQELSQMKVDFSIDELELKFLRKFMFKSYERYIYDEYGKNVGCSDRKCNDKIEEGVEFYDKAYIFRVQENIYGVIANKNANVKQYWIIESGVEKDFFSIDKNIPPFEWMEEWYKEKYNATDELIRKEKLRAISKHNRILEKGGYNYLIDDKGVYRIFRVGKGAKEGIKGHRYKVLLRYDEGYKKSILDRVENISITEYGQEIPKESLEYYKVMRKLRGRK